MTDDLKRKIEDIERELKVLRSRLPPLTKRQGFKRRSWGTAMPSDAVILETRESVRINRERWGDSFEGLFREGHCIDPWGYSGLELSTEVPEGSDDVDISHYFRSQN